MPRSPSVLGRGREEQITIIPQQRKGREGGTPPGKGKQIKPTVEEQSVGQRWGVVMLRAIGSKHR